MPSLITGGGVRLRSTGLPSHVPWELYRAIQIPPPAGVRPVDRGPFQAWRGRGRRGPRFSSTAGRTRNWRAAGLLAGDAEVFRDLLALPQECRIGAAGANGFELREQGSPGQGKAVVLFFGPELMESAGCCRARCNRRRPSPSGQPSHASPPDCRTRARMGSRRSNQSGWRAIRSLQKATPAGIGRGPRGFRGPVQRMWQSSVTRGAEIRHSSL